MILRAFQKGQRKNLVVIMSLASDAVKLARVYPSRVSSIHRACNHSSKKVALILDRLNLKSSVKQLIWK
jgi:hypothetical protein